MVNKCAAPSCRSGYVKNGTKKITTFHFPLKKIELNKLWIRFVNRQNWSPTKHSVLCEYHFEEKYIIRGGKSNLKWDLNPIPTKHSEQLLKGPKSLIPTASTARKPPKERSSAIPDEINTFQKIDTIANLDDLTETAERAGFQFRRSCYIS